MYIFWLSIMWTVSCEQLFVRVLVHVGQTWPSSLDIISTAFNCSHDTVHMILSQNIYMYGYGSWVVISIVLFDISKNYHFLVPNSTSWNIQHITYRMSLAVIDFSSGLVAHGQWKLIRTSDFCPNFSIESIEYSF
jgi:hypothetical protein